MSPFPVRAWLGAWLVGWLTVASPASGAVLFNEIQYHPVEKADFNADGSPVLDLTEDVHEFVELLNTGPGPLDLGGWTLTGGVQFSFPTGTSLPEGGFLVLSGHPGRIEVVYALPSGSVLGPWTGHLSNRRETLELRDRSGAVVESVAYRSESPWPISADALGAGDDWTHLRSEDYQYRGRSLERVSPTHPAGDPANWLASPLPAGPSPGRPNATTLSVPRPVVLAQDVRQAVDGSDIIRSGQATRIECVFTEGTGLSDVRLEWYREDLDAPDKPVTIQPMWPVGSGLDARFQAEVPGKPDRSVIRYRIRARRGDGDEVVSPRADDPMAWHGWFVTPRRAPTTNAIYDVFISRASLTILRTNIASQPRRVTGTGSAAQPRPSWNATQPAILVHDGHVYDIQMRHHGSQFRRDVTRKSYKVQFPDHARLEGHESLFITDKDQKTVSGHTVFRAAGLPTSRTWWSDLYMNNDARLRRLAQEEYDEFLLERHHAEEAAARGRTEPEPAGEFFKSQGVFDEPTGPYGRGDGTRLKNLVSAGKTHWTSLQRYEWTYTQQMHGWKGHLAFGEMLTNLWLTRGNSQNAPTGILTNRLHDYFTNSWDVEKTLTHVALVNWQGVWDDTIHNYFLWRQANGRWSLLPWDFDDQFETQSASTSIFNGAPFAGANFFKQSIIAGLRDEFRARAWWLNNTLLDPDNLASLGLPTSTRTWAVNRQRSVNTQLQMGIFSRPLRPSNQFPAPGDSAGPGSSLVASAYLYNTNPIVPHAASVWQIREPDRSWLEPVLTATNRDPLTSFTLGHGLLVPGRTYGWRVQHVDELGHPSPWSSETRFVFGPESGSAVLLNELLAVNTGSVRNGADRPDFLELVNRSTAEVNLGGWAVTDDLTNPSQFVLPEGTRIPAGGFLILWCDSRRNSPGLHTGFGLQREGETVGLFAPGASGLRLVDLVTFGPQLPDLAVGRTGAADGPWAPVTPSPAAANTPVELGDPGSVRINEWLTSASNTADWFEVFNPDRRPVDLRGLVASDGTDDSALPPLTLIAGGGFLKLTADGVPKPVEDHVNFRLSVGGGEILLRRPDRTLVDRIFYPRQQRGVSQGRLPDGGEGVYALLRPSPEATNASDADFDGLPDVWELTHHLDPLSPNAGADPDGDGWSNALEFQLGLDPQDAVSTLRLALERSADRSSPDALSFLATPGVRYVVERHAAVSAGWQLFQAIDPAPTTRPVTIPLLLNDGDPGGIFRVRIE
ncbi:MAG: lamin tail domain-containing protein [Verrucomicrobiales bacterium]|nr:lamin tail domain-containing protein [Verrucomicrobiales bacterium]